MQIPFIDLKEQHQRIGKAVRSAVLKVVDSQRFVLGAQGKRLEAAIAKKVGVSHAVGVASGSDALYLSFLALGIGPGDEVITTPFTFFATAGAISRTGARPVFADIHPKTFNIDPSRIQEKITKRTKAIVPVHLFGLCCDMKPILILAKKHSLFIVEDAAQAFGAEYHGKRAGSFGHAGCFSFYPTKNLGGGGDGGMIVTASTSLADKFRLLRDHGSRKKYFHEIVGLNSRLDEIQAAIIFEKLKHIERYNRLRQKHAADYGGGLKGLPVETPFTPPKQSHAFHLYSILTKRRDALISFLNQKGIGTGVYYPLPLHFQPCYAVFGYKKGDFPVSERVASEILSLPMYPEMTRRQKEAVITAIHDFFKR